MKLHFPLTVLFLLCSQTIGTSHAAAAGRNEINLPQFCGQLTNESTYTTSDLSLVVHYLSNNEKTVLKEETLPIDESGKYCIPAQSFKKMKSIITSLDLVSKGQILPIEGFKWQFSTSPILRLHPYFISSDFNKKGAEILVKAYSHLILREFKESQQVLNIKTIYEKTFAELAKDAQKRIYPDETTSLPWAIEVSNTITVQNSSWAKPRFTFKTILDSNPAERCGDLLPSSEGAPGDLMSACIASSATDFKIGTNFSASLFSAKRGKTLLLSNDLTEEILANMVRETSSSIVFYRDGKIDQKVPMMLYLFEDFPDHCDYISNDNSDQIFGVRCNGPLSDLLEEQNYVLGID